ncbi:MAG TPA: 6-phosphogluconolactonase [Pseudomonadales bacterium]
MTSGPEIRWHRHRDLAALTAAVLERLGQHAQRAIAARQSFHVVLSGGSTPRPLYGAAVGIETDWSCWHIYFADERCLPRGHAERNDRMASEAWLDRMPIPPGQIHPIPAELGPEAAAEAYRRTLASVGPFDLVLLGLGEDGHTASLFPGHDPGTGAGAPAALPVTDAPKPPPQRVSLSAARLADARAVEVLVSGADKAEAVRRLRDGEALPIRAVTPAAGLDVHVDAAAARWI